MKQFFKSFRELDTKTESLKEAGLSESYDRATAAFDLLIKEQTHYTCDRRDSMYHFHPDPSSMKRIFNQQGYEKIEGLCLDCEERDFNGVNEGQCKFGHGIPD